LAAREAKVADLQRRTIHILRQQKLDSQKEEEKKREEEQIENNNKIQIREITQHTLAGLRSRWITWCSLMNFNPVTKP
jgi:hypothetical protein